uniref:Uncharacterized protein n=1 Tax=Ditylenchus dipsaci TaxID=166011 RepID=A0A915DXW6_9BILA
MCLFDDLVIDLVIEIRRNLQLQKQRLEAIGLEPPHTNRSQRAYKRCSSVIMASASVKGFVREADLKKLLETRNKEARDTDITATRKVNSNKEGVLISALMFIFMVKRHLHEVIDKENGIGINMLKEFLNLVGVVEMTYLLRGLDLVEQLNSYHKAGSNRCQRRRGNILQLGPRAETVVDKKQMLESFCRIYGSKVEEWSRHAAISGIKVSKHFSHVIV